MVTQKITTRLSNDVLPPVRMVSGDVGREIQLEIYANDESLAPIDLETYSARITIIKPDKTFVIQDFDNDKVELPEQAGAVTGHGYYQIKIYTAGDHQIYTGQGPFIVDDDVLSEEMIESVAEVNGYEFPDDFLTDADLREYVTKYELEDALAGIIDDDTTDYNSTWSSAKISEALSSVTKTAEGNPIEFSDGADAPLVKCVTEIQGSQDLHGYDKPWVGGAGKNKFNKDGTDTTNGYVANKYLFPNGDEVIPSSGYWFISEYIPAVGGQSYTISGLSNTDSNAPSFNFYDSNKALLQGVSYNNRTNITHTSPNGTAYIRVSCGPTTSIKDSLQLELGSPATSYEPYSNICPITAYTEGEIEVSDGDGNTTTHTTTYPSAIYRGSEDCVNGEVTSEWGMIASYAGETLPGEWISDRDEYAPGTTPTTGAQVAYKLATPTTSSVTPTNLPIKSLSGYNHIESSTGEMEIEYIKQTYDAIMEATKLDNMKVYSTAEQVVGKWIDGRAVYEKTFVITPASPPMDWVGFFTVNMADLVSVEGYTTYTAGGQAAYTTLYDAYFGCRFAYNPVIARGQLCYYYTNSDVTKIVVTIRYTKGV